MHCKAHQGGASMTAAQQQLVLRYHGAVYRYLLGMLRDAGAAEELSQEFAVRFLRGDFAGANPQRGRFRDFLKTALRHLVIDHWRQKDRDRKQAPLPDEPADTAAEAGTLAESDAAFLAGWREELFARTWKALAQGPPEAAPPSPPRPPSTLQHP